MRVRRKVQAAPCSRSTLAGPSDAGGMQAWPAAKQAQHRHHARAAAGSRALGRTVAFFPARGSTLTRYGGVCAVLHAGRRCGYGRESSGIFLYLHYLAAVSTAPWNEAFRDARRPPILCMEGPSKVWATTETGHHSRAQFIALAWFFAHCHPTI